MVNKFSALTLCLCRSTSSANFLYGTVPITYQCRDWRMATLILQIKVHFQVGHRHWPTIVKVHSTDQYGERFHKS
jgi:hypothetical protein